MAGFGSDPFGFGHSPFGQWDYSAYTLFQLAPDLYRQVDPSYDDAFQRYARGLRPSFDALKLKIQSFADLREPLRVRTQYDLVETLRLGPEVTKLGLLEQRGIDGTVSAFQEFQTPTGRFSFDDVGKELVFSGSTIPANNIRVTIIRIVSPSSILTSPALATDATPFRWDLHQAIVRDPTVRTVRVQSGSVDNISLGWLVTDGVSKFEIVGRRHFTWDDPIRKSFTVQEGTDGYFDLVGNLVVATGVFTGVNIGQKILTSGADRNNLGVWEITAISAGGPPWVLTLLQSGDRVPDQTPYYWALLPREELDLKAIPQPRGVATKYGLQGSVIAANQFVVGDGLFDAQDATPIKFLTVRGSLLGNDGNYQVTSVTVPYTLVVSPPFPGGVEGGLVWELRQGTNFGDNTQVQAYASSMITDLVQDFGITVDERESEFLQRSNADHVGRWVDIKGVEQSYEVLGELTGMEVTVEKLWRVSQELFLWLGSAGYTSQTLEAGDAAAGRSGQTGRLIFIAGRVHLRDLGARFIPADVGLVVRVAHSSDVLNSKLYTVDQYISSTEIAFRVVDSAATPDYGTGGSVSDPMLWWSLQRLYTTKEPRRPYMDDFNSDLLTDIVNFAAPLTDTFSVDRYCWEPDFSSSVPYVPVSVVPGVGQYVWTVTVQTPAGQPGSAEVILVPVHWVLVDAVGDEYGIDSIPVAAGVGQWSFSVFGVNPPVFVGPNPTYLFYDCPLTIECDFCASNWISARIGFGPVLASEIGPSIENIFTRTLERIEQVKPAHVRIVSRYVREIEAKLTLTADIETHPFLYATLVAPITAFYDDFPADDYPADTVLLASIETDVSWLINILDATLNPLFDNYPADDLYSDNSLGATIDPDVP